MSDIFYEEIEILKIHYRPGLDPDRMGGRPESVFKIEEILLKDMPDFVLVYGDTNSTLAGGLAAAKLHIPVAHVNIEMYIFSDCSKKEVRLLRIILMMPSYNT